MRNHCVASNSVSAPPQYVLVLLYWLMKNKDRERESKRERDSTSSALQLYFHLVIFQSNLGGHPKYLTSWCTSAVLHIHNLCRKINVSFVTTYADLRGGEGGGRVFWPRLPFSCFWAFTTIFSISTKSSRLRTLYHSGRPRRKLYVYSVRFVGLFEFPWACMCVLLAFTGVHSLFAYQSSSNLLWLCW